MADLTRSYVPVTIKPVDFTETWIGYKILNSKFSPLGHWKVYFHSLFIVTFGFSPRRMDSSFLASFISNLRHCLLLN